GLSQAGWNKYSYIDVEFDNQIICKRRAAQQTTNEHQQPKQEEKIQTEVSE
ncbi:MAG: cell division protein FtsQ, partial [Prevotella pallens]|nr:cell division protein FtsQ [Prevotella pallens]